MIRVGVDVGGTFTKAVAIESQSNEIVATSVIPTTHRHEGGVAHGVVEAVAEVAGIVGADNISLVTHSTTQAVNALLEGDVGVVGVIGLARHPDVKAAMKRTQLLDVEASAGKPLRIVRAFFDVTEGLVVDDVRRTLEQWRADSVSAVCVAEAFSPDDVTNEHLVRDLAHELGFPVCASTDLSGLYGLELRAVTAALNASILPIAVATAGFVADGVRNAGITAPVMVMRSDGGATDLKSFGTAPVRTLYSGPAASVAGALRYTGVSNAVVVEVGGTSSNVAAIHHGQPVLSYVRVASHATALRSVDVRVVGVAGGSMLRVRKRRVYGVGPRSAHIAGLPYACYLKLEELDGAEPELIAAQPGDPNEYLVLRLADGRRAAITNTCAANALGYAKPDDYCYAPPASAIAAFVVAARAVRVAGPKVAEQMLVCSGAAICELILAVKAGDKEGDPHIVGVGGGAGGLARYVAEMLGMRIEIPEHAEVISSIGDALSLLRAESERTSTDDPVSAIAALMDEVEQEILAAGASPSSIEVRIEEVPERSTMRAIAIGAVGLAAGALPGRVELDEAIIRSKAGQGRKVVPAGRYWLMESDKDAELVDRYGEVVLQMRGGRYAEAALADAILEHTTFRGPMTIKPTVWIIDAHRVIELASFTVESNRYVGRDVVYLVGKAR